MPSLQVLSLLNPTPSMPTNNTEEIFHIGSWGGTSSPPTRGSSWRKVAWENLPGGMLVTFLVYLHGYLDKSASITKFFQGSSSVSRNCSCSHLTLSRKYSVTSSKMLWLSRQENKNWRFEKLWCDVNSIKYKWLRFTFLSSIHLACCWWIYLGSQVDRMHQPQFIS